VRTDFSASYFATFPAHDAPSAASVVDDFDFSSPGVLDGSWNHSAHLRGTLGTGFNIYVHTEHLGHLPSRLKFNDHDERGYVEALLRDGVISRGSPVFSHKHFFVRQGSKLRLIFDGRRINARCPGPPSFDMLSHHELAALAAACKGELNGSSRCAKCSHYEVQISENLHQILFDWNRGFGFFLGR